MPRSSINERAVADWLVQLFRQLGSEVRAEQVINGIRVDLLVDSNGLLSPVEVMTNRGQMTVSRLLETAARLQSISEAVPTIGTPIIATIEELSPEARKWVAEKFKIAIWDVPYLRNKAGEFAGLRESFNDLLRYQETPSGDYSRKEQANSFIKSLKYHVKNKDSLTPSEYENLCLKVSVFLFDPYLTAFKKLATTDDANRYDFICRIKSGAPFWDTLARDFRTRSILFECKNYEKKITADQIYSTERYLFSGALRTVCFLISRLGPDDGCKRAAQGALRESGKLILLLSNNDLIRMLQFTEEDGPQSYIEEAIWDFVTTLPR
jgi:hypothetical protein